MSSKRTNRRRNNRGNGGRNNRGAKDACFIATIAALAVIAVVSVMMMFYNKSIDRRLAQFHDEILEEVTGLRQGEATDSITSPLDSDKPTTIDPTVSDDADVADTAQAEPETTPTPTSTVDNSNYTTQTEVKYHPETNDEMIAYLITQGKDEEFLPLHARDLAWWTDGDGKVVDMLRPGRTYTAHFYIYALAPDRILKNAYLRMTSAQENITGGFYVFPGETFELDGLMVSANFVDSEGYTWTDFTLPTVSATDEALGITIDTSSFKVRQAYGTKSWKISQKDAEAMLEGERLTVGTDGLNGYFEPTRENAIEFTFQATTSKNGLASPVTFIRGDGKIACYDYLETDVFDRWSFPDLSPSQYDKICEEGVYPAG